MLSALALAPAAHAADLLVLDSEQATVSGNQNLGFVYVDGELRLTGDTTITAGSIYFGPNASLRTCFVEGSGPGTGNGACTTGRSLTLRSTGQLILSPGVDLTTNTGAVHNAGSLTLQGAQVAVGGDLNTTGSGGGSSGAVSVSSGGPLSVGAIYAYGAAVSLGATGAIDVGGDIQAQGTNTIAQPDPGRVQAGGSVTVNSSAGDVRITGNVNSSGRDAPAGPSASGLPGGYGADISISGSDVRTGALDATGGSSADSSAGTSGRITVNARGAFHALGRLDASGQNSNLGQATGGSPISATAGGSLILAGGAYSSGGQGSLGGMPGGQIAVSGQTVTTGPLFVAGANAPNSLTPGDGGKGGSVAVSSTGNASISSIQSYGGNGATARGAGYGGPITVSSTAGSIATGRLSSQAGQVNQAPGAGGGPVWLSAQNDLTVADALITNGSNASGDVTPARSGGNAGNVLLRAATGKLTLGDAVRAEGGFGAGNPNEGEFGGRGGDGGHIDIVTGTLGPIVSLSSHGGGGGDGGDDRGPGGAGGSVFAWTDAPLFDDQRVVDTDGGDGNPTGPAGAKTSELSPTTVAIDAATGLLSFTSRSPDAEKYRVLRSSGGAAPVVALESTATSGLKPSAPACEPVTFTVVAVQSGVGWTSAPSAAVPYTRPASSTQECNDPPTLSAAKKLRFSKRKLRKAKWRANVALRSSGIGTAQVSLLRAPRKGHRTSTRALAKVTAKWTRPGSQNVRITLPKSARRTGRYLLRLVATAPDGKGRRTTTLKLEVRR